MLVWMEATPKTMGPTPLGLLFQSARPVSFLALQARHPLCDRDQRGQSDSSGSPSSLWSLPTLMSRFPVVFHIHGGVLTPLPSTRDQT